MDEEGEEAETFADLQPLDEQCREAASTSLAKVRRGIRKIRASPHRRQAWMDICREKLMKQLMPILDVSVRWSSTFNMLNRIIKYQNVSEFGEPPLPTCVE